MDEHFTHFLLHYVTGALLGASLASIYFSYQHRRDVRARAALSAIDFAIMVVLLQGPLAQPAISAMIRQFIGDARHDVITMRLHAMRDAGLLKCDLYSGIAVYRWHNFQAPTEQTLDATRSASGMGIVQAD